MKREFHSHLNNIRDKLTELHIPRDSFIFEGHYLDHTARMPGYLPVESVKWTEYSGRFGTGYIVLRHDPASKRYVLKDYWLEGDEPRCKEGDLYRRIVEGGLNPSMITTK